MTINWLQADWPAADFIKSGTTLRSGGVSSTPYDSFNLATHVGDDLVAVNENRTKLALQLGLSVEPQWLQQTHSTDAVMLPYEQNIPKADAVYTMNENTVCAVMTADCLPLLITDKQGTCVAAVHAGWRGLCDGIIEKTINKLPAKPDSLLVWLGPAIGPDVYEVGKEVYDAFTQSDFEAKHAFTSTKEHHWLLDMYHMARLRLNKLGVTHIYGGKRCTLSEEEHFFSYRRDGDTGRMASLIWIDK